MNLKMMLSRLLGPVLAAASLVAHAQSVSPLQPSSKPITIVVPYVAGGTTDMLARSVAEVIRQQSGRTAVVENKPGAGGAIAGRFVARSEPDGSTLFMTSSGIHAITPVVYKGFDAEGTLSQVSILVDVPFVMSIRPNFPAENMAEFVAQAKSQPGQVRIGNASLGSHGHLTQILFDKAAGIELNAVPYKGSVPALNDLLGGHIDAVIDNVGVQKPFIDTAKIRPLFVTSAERSPALPNVPTATELGLPFESVAWFGLAAPKKTPHEFVAQLQSMIAKGFSDPTLRARLVDAGLTPVFSTPEQAEARAKADTKTLGQLAATLDLAQQ